MWVFLMSGMVIYMNININFIKIVVVTVADVKPRERVIEELTWVLHLPLRLTYHQGRKLPVLYGRIGAVGRHGEH